MGNTAGYDGGVFADFDGNVWLKGGYNRANIGAESGGVLFVTSDTTVVWEGGKSTNNSAAVGGSLHVSSVVTVFRQGQTFSLPGRT